MDEFFDFGNRPGNLYVVATLLPLLSFLVLLLWNGVRAYLRKFYDPEEPGTIGALYEAIDGPGRTRIGAYVATAAIFVSFLLTLYGFILHRAEADALHAQGQPERREQIDPKKEKDHHQKEQEFKKRWSASIRWSWLTVAEKPRNQAHDGHKAAKGEKAKSSEPVGLHLSDNAHATALTLGYKIDHLSTIMFLMVSFIAALIHVFSIGYMGEELQRVVEDHEVHTVDGHLHRRGRFTNFFMFLSLFCFSMLNLVLADNLFQVFVSWELVGICSFLLIGFYFERQSASNAANKAFITNRVGDAGFIIGLLIVWTYFGTFNFDAIFARVRAPERDTHGTLYPMAGKIVRAEPAEIDPKDAAEFARSGTRALRVLKEGEAVGRATHALLMPRGVLVTEEDVQSKKEKEPHFHSLEYGETVFVRDNPSSDDYGSMPYWVLVLAGIGIFVGCVGKSAQFPLHVWLPDAMEGPTPVSALIHAATMVAAGVYLVGRVYPLFTPEALLVIAYVGAITLFVAATIAIVMTDIKKVLAYSTVSQLGYMMLALGIGGWVAGLFHLVTHAFFKALLFLGSGSVIYGCHHVQEMTRMGGLYPKMRITALTMLMGVLAIAGTPLFSGWYSKDAIIAQAFGYGNVHPEHFLLTLLPLMTAGITTFYMFRMWFLTFTGEPRDEHVFEHARESPPVMTIPLIILAVCSVAVAWGWPLWDAHASALGQHIHQAEPRAALDFGYVPGHEHYMLLQPLPANYTQTVRYQTHEWHLAGGLIALGVVIIGFVFAASVYWFRLLDPDEAKAQAASVYNFLARKWHFDELYSVMLVRPALVVAGWCRWFDAYVIDGIIHFVARAAVWGSWVGGLADRYIVDGIVNWVAEVCYGMGSRLRNVQTGYLRSYVLFLVLAAVGIWIVLALLAGALSAGM